MSNHFFRIAAPLSGEMVYKRSFFIEIYTKGCFCTCFHGRKAWSGVYNECFAFNLHRRALIRVWHTAAGLYYSLYIVYRSPGKPQIVVHEETRNAVLGVSALNSPNFNVFTPFGLPKIRKKLLKNLLHSICCMYIIQRLVKCEEAGSYRASG